MRITTRKAFGLTKLFAVALLAAAAGCGGSGLPSLTGTVTIDGKPAPAGVALQFSPTAEGGSPSYAQTDADGKYEAQFSFNKTGIQLGEHSVKLIPGSVETPMPEIGPDGKPVGPAPKNPMGSLPKSYWEEIEVIQVEPGSNTHDFALTSE
ncbi:carboxypeptidase regulatory-like domain-containing protein [Bremerella sp.]|uniref:carboxypeptidase regulatory-like domain-containing protein n=1 Tax=Bremerella sp. TaxID=2795602 RepID=UPI00391A361D